VTGELSAADFPRFFRQVYGEDPFPWQRALVARVLEEGRWPEAVDVPTGMGKTSLIDVAVFAAAASPEAGRRRVFFVVDRRLVVDEAYEHALRLRDALGSAAGICGEVARRLRQRGDDPGAAVLEVTRMRGGVTWSWRWLERPDRHAVITGTVDQVGSRLLFRGYGVGEYLRPVDAALTGTDSLVIIDEAHLAESFVRTIRHAAAAEPGGPWRPPAIITMSATTALRPGTRVHQVSVADEQDERAAQRLHAPAVSTC
jgi:CRISPR-associated endonuclease/helicase Cas3